MAGKWLIDVTDKRFDIPPNADVLDFVRRVNPFAHSDVGSLLLDLGKRVEGAHAYSPSYAQCAYVVLHTEARKIVAIAFGQSGLAFRLPPVSRAAALEDGGGAATEIGPEWVLFNPWDPGVARERMDARLQRWCGEAFAAPARPAQGASEMD
jgi:hypothetical protein